MKPKADPTNPIPANDLMAAASQALTKALSDAQEAIATARAERSQAAAALEEMQFKFDAVQAQVQELQDLTARQREEIQTLRARSAEFDQELTSERTKAAEMLNLREGVITLLNKQQDKLKNASARFIREKEKFVDDQRAARSAVASLKNTVKDLESRFAKDENDDHDGGGEGSQTSDALSS
ncbi:hypothetical protein MSAN_02066500 [Mycena sanguinolenta]|uniref:Uncharacterized protein n=1 Tax=Mycena sanguinolenta TaxID=230812 RepID=A0A8H7CMS3_9AGAR|nr:hypothetical protein MSAN_02066500 [Mycena sanguinolenta]